LEILLFSVLRLACFNIDKAQRHQYSTFDVGRSMFDVQSVHCSGQAESHTKIHISGSEFTYNQIYTGEPGTFKLLQKEV